MSNAIVTVLPYAIGAAISPLLLTLQALILSGGVKPRLHGWLYTAGAAVVAAVFIVLCATVLSSLDSGGGSPSDVERGIHITGSLLLLVLAVRQFLPPKTPGEHHQNRIAGEIKDGKDWFFLAAGAVAMITNISSLIIIIPGVRHVTEAGSDTATTVAALLVLLLFTTLPALIPVGLATVFGKRADGVLSWMNAFVTKHSRTITAVICLALSAYLGYTALA